MTTAQSNLAGLSRYIFGTPAWYASIAFALVVAALTGIIAVSSHPIRGAWQGVFFVGVPTIIAGVLTPSIDRAFGGNLTFGRSSFLALVCEFLVVIFVIIAAFVSVVVGFGQQFLLDTLVAALAVVFAVRLVVVLVVSRVSLLTAVVPASVQTLATALLLFVYSGTLLSLSSGGPVLETSLSPEKVPPGLLLVHPSDFALLGTLSVLYAGTAYGLLVVIDRPVKRSLDVSSFDFIHGFMAHVAGSTTELEAFFERIGQTVVVPITVLSFRRPEATEFSSSPVRVDQEDQSESASETGTEIARFVLPMIHPGPMGEIGGGKLPQRIAETAEGLAFPLHATASHDFNLVSQHEVDTLLAAVERATARIEYNDTVTPSVRAAAGDATVLGQSFGDGILLTASFSPAFADDIDYGVGRTVMAEARAAGVENVLLADAHNCNNGLSGPDLGHVSPGGRRAVDLAQAATNAADNLTRVEQELLSLGVAWDSTDWTPTEGIGQLGIRVAVIEVGSQRTAYVLIDGNNMEPGLRERIVASTDAVDAIEVLTTDTHVVNRIDATNQVGARLDEDAFIAVIERLIEEAITDITSVEVGMVTEHTEVMVFGNDRTARFDSLATVMVTTGVGLIAVALVIGMAITVMLFSLV
jgi:putative membrane protein